MAGATVTDRPLVLLPLGLSSAFLGGLHALTWQSDPCSRYRMETKRRHLSTNSLASVAAAASSSADGPVVLVRRTTNKSNRAATGIAAGALAYVLYKAWLSSE